MNKLQKWSSEFDKINQKTLEMHQEIGVYGYTIVKELFEDFFKKYPNVKIVTWGQYTPGFNDGDVCVFRVHDPDIWTDELITTCNDCDWAYIDLSSEDSIMKTSCKYYGHGFCQENGAVKVEIWNSLYEILNPFEEINDFHKLVFGENSFICITPNGIMTKYYRPH